MKITKESIEAAAFMFVNNEALDAVAHDFKVEAPELQRVVEYLEDNTDMVEQAIVDYFEGREI